LRTITPSPSAATSAAASSAAGPDGTDWRKLSWLLRRERSSSFLAAVAQRGSAREMPSKRMGGYQGTAGSTSDLHGRNGARALRFARRPQEFFNLRTRSATCTATILNLMGACRRGPARTQRIIRCPAAAHPIGEKGAGR
jgi:hypothetical protein